MELVTVTASTTCKNKNKYCLFAFRDQKNDSLSVKRQILRKYHVRKVLVLWCRIFVQQYEFIHLKLEHCGLLDFA